MLNLLSLCFTKPKLNVNKNFIIQKIKENNINILCRVDISDLYLHLYKNFNTEDFVSLFVKDNFIIDFHNRYLLNNLEIKDLQYFNMVIRKLITFYLFFNFNNNINILNLLIRKPILFDLQLWISLLLNPLYTNEEQQLFITLYLVKNNIITIYKPIQYYDIKFNVFELIIIGKVDIVDNKIRHNRFMNTDHISKFIKEVYKYSTLIINSELILLLEKFYLKNPNYVEKIIALLNSPFIS